jgi:RecA-family ATPase
MAEAPSWLAEKLEEKVEGQGTPVDTKAVLDGIPEGERDHEIFRYACRLRAKNMDRAEADVLVLEAAKACSPPFPSDEAIRKVDQAWKYQPGEESGNRAPTESLYVEIDAPKADRSRVKIVMVEEMMKTEYPPVRWVVEGLIPEGLTMVTAAPKIGKSWWALNLSRTVSQGGGTFMGRYTSGEGTVLYFDLEQSEWKMKDRIVTVREKHQKEGLPVAPEKAIRLVYEWPKFDDGGLEILDQYLEENPEVRLVVFDVFAKIRGQMKGSGNAYEREYDQLSGVKSVFDRRRVAGVAIHHDTKNQEGDPIDRISGSRAASGACDVLIVLDRKRGQQEGRIFATGRDIEDVDQPIRFDTTTMQWVLDESLASQVKKVYSDPDEGFEI